jgi:hypothetical protein
MGLIAILILPILALAATALALFRSLRNMRISMGAGVVLFRCENPVLFWLTVTLQCLALGAVIAIILAACFNYSRFELT